MNLRSAILLSLFFFFSLNLFAQNEYHFLVRDDEADEPLVGATVILKGTTYGVLTDTDGNAVLNDIPNGEQTFVFSYVGFKRQEITITFPVDELDLHIVSMVPAEMDEVIIEATRANKSVSNLPTRTEVLTEEIDEAASMEPSRIAHLITHSTGIQVQTTSAGSNGAVVRFQGLQGRYSQILKDGFPLYGGLSGSLDILQIPPLDLRQVEYIKGSASTLYGGGAIGGLINLLTKRPDAEEILLHVNLSHIGAKDFNGFFSKRFGKWGVTNLASAHFHSAYDPDDDGFADIPEVRKLNFNPKVYFYPDESSEVWFGANIQHETRAGGQVFNDFPDSTNFYSDNQETDRYVTQLFATKRWGLGSSVTFKNSISSLDRELSIVQDTNATTAFFKGNQFNAFTELNYNLNREKHNFTLGMNIYNDRFFEERFDTLTPRDQTISTFGVFANHLWDITSRFAVESGLRADGARAVSRLSSMQSEFFVLPRLSALYKINMNFSVRLGGGMGYRMPTIFNEESEPFGYMNIQPIDYSAVEPERSYGGNFDFKYRTTFGKDNLLLTFNQLFFYNAIQNPIQLFYFAPTDIRYQSSLVDQESRGFESQIKFTFWKFTWFFGYTYTEAYLKDLNEEQLPLTPKHSIKGDLLFVEEGKWRIGWDYEYKSAQMLAVGLATRELFTTGVVVERTIDNFVIFLNAENFTDARQTRFESLLSGPNQTPQFTEVWAPLDGFFFNAGLKIKL